MFALSRTATRRVPAPFTSNWSLFDAVQRLPGPSTPSLSFTLLEDLDLPKEGQRLSYREAADLEVGGKTLRLQGYQQLGEGVLPWRYWLDGAHRLLFVTTGIRAYVWDPEAERQTQELVQAAAERNRRRGQEVRSNR